MDTSSHSLSPPAVATPRTASARPETPPLDATEADALAASTLSVLANASASAGPLKKRRKVDKDSASEGELDMAPSNEESKSRDDDTKYDVGERASETTPFPVLLHKLLAKGNDKGEQAKSNADDTAISSALEWLPHGKGWRVLRWDALCTEVLPKEFPELCQEIFPNDGMYADHTKEEGRDDEAEKEVEWSDEQWVEAFLLHVKSWGFNEVKVGRDRGSFRNHVS
ncbi:hypothetical protein ACHAWF_012387 [Thalassiosira exigua]